MAEKIPSAVWSNVSFTICRPVSAIRCLKARCQPCKALVSIGAVKGVEIGDGFSVCTATGLTNNDAFHVNADGSIVKLTNHAGGILGGISDGSDIVVRAGFKPTPSVAASQQTINKDGENIAIEIKGRHDPIIVARAVVVVECMTALVWRTHCSSA